MDRRAMARRNATTTEAEWEAMTECIVQQHMAKVGHFFLHVSKSGGTSMGVLMENANCFSANKTKLVGYGDWNAKQLKMDCNWYQRHHPQLTQHNVSFEAFGKWKGAQALDTNCDRLSGLMKNKQRVAMHSEAMIPFHRPTNREPLCPNMVNSIMFREPLQRLESHYREMRKACKTRYCDAAFYTNSSKTYLDLPKLVNMLDIISDNYYTRSLRGHEWFAWKAPKPYTKQDSAQSTMNGTHQISSISLHPDAYTKLLPMANQSLHAFDWVLIMGAGHPEEAANRNAILHSGLGLIDNKEKELPHSRKGATHSRLSDPVMAQALNALDYVLWQEALQLNQLDAIAAKRMQPFFDKASQKWTTIQKDNSLACCGNVCNNFTTN